MTCVLMVAVMCLSIVQLLNSESRAGDIARRLVEALIARVTGRRKAVEAADEEPAP